MKNLIKSIVVTIVFSFYLFPVEFSILPGINSKMMLAMVGLIILLFQALERRELLIDKRVLGVFVFALLYSLVSYCSVVYNNTNQYVYASYFVSMSVWLSGAYSVIKLIEYYHGKSSLQLIFHYMAIVCVLQCILALLIDNIPIMKHWVNMVFIQDYEFLSRTGRLYGIGAWFDTAGIRFSCALIGIGYLLLEIRSEKWIVLYVIMASIIVIIGNFMSRTTSVGVILLIAYILLMRFRFKSEIAKSTIQLFTKIIILISFLFIAFLFLYNNVPEVYNYSQFAFEGILNYWDKGELGTDSTDKLMKMWKVVPDNLKTWIIGDGFFDDPHGGRGFYKGTDVGYYRLIFYSGLLGLFCFVGYFLYCTFMLVAKYPKNRMIFYMLLLLQLLVWIKISTDIFCVFALLLLLPQTENRVTMSIFRD